MEKKTLIVLGGAFGALLAVCAFLLFLGRPTARPYNPLSGVDPDKIVKIVTDNKVAKIILEKKGKEWDVTAPVQDIAEPSAVNLLLDTAHNFNVSSILSENKSRYDQYGFSTPYSTHLQIFVAGKDKPALDGYVGKQGASYSDCYFRFEGKDAVYLAHDMPVYVFRKQPNDVRFQKLFGALLSEATGAVFEGAVSVSLTRSSATWTNEKNKKVVDATWMKALSDKTGMLYLMGFGKGDEPPATLGFDKPYLKIVLKGTDNVTAVIGNSVLPLPAKPEKPNRYAQTEGRKGVLILRGQQIDELVSHLKTLPS